MIYVTTAPNDKDLLTYLGPMAVGAPIPYGDVLFQSKPDEETNKSEYWICGERKKAMDLINCISDGRHIKQVRDAIGAGFEYYFLIVECIQRQGQDGLFEYRTGNNWTRTSMSWSRVQGYLHQLHYLMGVQVLFSPSARATSETVKALFQFFQQGFDEHSSLKKFYSPQPALLLNPSLIRSVANQLPGVGWERSIAIEGHFGSIRDMINADEDEWMKIPGIGKGLSKSITEALT